VVTEIFSFVVLGVILGAGYAIAALGLVVTYTTSRVFNIAHGAVGMVSAFVFWEIAYNQKWLPPLLALAVVVLVAAPTFGVVIERVMMRRLTDAPVSVSLVVTVGLLVLLFGVAQTIWPPKGRFVPGFFPDSGFDIGDTRVQAGDVLTFVAALAVAGGLYLLLNKTRLGAAMRATVDNRGLLALHGGRPAYLGSFSWGLGAGLAALAGCLLAPTVQLDYYGLTFLVISAYAAAMLGRLQSLPRTFAGAIALGVIQTLVNAYVPNSFGVLRPAVPALFLFLLLLFLPQVQLRIGQVKGIVSVPVPSLQRSLVSGAVLLGGVMVFSTLLSVTQKGQLALGFVFALVMLSLVLLTGYGGYVSLGQFSFVGLGALIVARTHSGSPLVLLLATVATGLIGGLVALPVLRLRGLYLALATLAFAQFMDKTIFVTDRFGFGQGGSLIARKLDLFGVRLTSASAYLALCTFAFAAVGIGVLALRRGRYGRLLIAQRDSPAACGTLGVSLTWTRVGLFALSSSIAGLAGGIYAGLQESVGALPFQLLQSLPLLLLAVVGGITSVTGAAIGGIVLELLPILADKVPSVAGLVFLLIGAAAVALGRNPNGVASLAFTSTRSLNRRFRPRSVGTSRPTGGFVPSYAGGGDLLREEVSVGAAP